MTCTLLEGGAGIPIGGRSPLLLLGAADSLGGGGGILVPERKADQYHVQRHVWVCTMEIFEMISQRGAVLKVIDNFKFSFSVNLVNDAKNSDAVKKIVRHSRNSTKKEA